MAITVIAVGLHRASVVPFHSQFLIFFFFFTRIDNKGKLQEKMEKKITKMKKTNQC